MAILLGIALLAVTYFYGRSIAVQLSKSFREAGIFLLVLLGVLAIAVLAFYSNYNL